MDRLPPIPTPPAQLWREMRIRLAPGLMFLAVATAILLLWRQNLAAPMVIGEVEAIRANVSSPRPGKLAQLNVTRLQRVKAGDVIAYVITTDPEILQSSLAVIQAEIQLLRVNLEPVLGQQRVAMSYDRLRLDWMEQRVQLVTARIKLDLAQSELGRAEELFKDKVVSQYLLDTARSTKESLQAEVKERSRLVAEQEEKLRSLGLVGDHSPYKEPSPEDVMQASIKVEEEKLRLTEADLKPIELTVQMDGVVTAIHHRSGEAIAAGEPIITLAAMTSDRIVGYVRQPLAFQPTVGMKVEVRPRSLNRAAALAEILEVGCQIEPISSNLMLRSAQMPELALPILVSLPPAQQLLPGEVVDLRILPGSQPLSRAIPEVTQIR